MNRLASAPRRFDSLADLHWALGLPQPLHPLLSLVDNRDHHLDLQPLTTPFSLPCYKISYKPQLQGSFRYGQRTYDFDEGGLLFVAPNQVGAGPVSSQDHAGYTLLVHPDFLRPYPLAKRITQYGFFSYAVHEALHLSEAEKRVVLNLFDLIGEELANRLDALSQPVLISQLELLLHYVDRFYRRQFLMRQPLNHDLLQQVEDALTRYLTSDTLAVRGLPTVQYLASCVHLSPTYLSDLLRSLTGQNAQQYIHQQLIEKAKEQLTSTRLRVSEVAYALGFEHAQSFSKLFKQKTSCSPLAFRRSFQ